MAPPRLSPLHREVLASHQERLLTLTGKVAPAKLKAIYDRAQADVAQKLARAVRAGRGKAYGAAHHRVVLSQLRQGQAQIAHTMTGALGQVSASTQHAALRGLIKDVSRLEAHHRGFPTALPIEEAATFSGIIRGRQPSLMKQHAASMNNYGSSLVKKMQGQLSTSLLTGESTSDAIDRVAETADLEWWKAERIVRTETAWAYNATQVDAVAATAKDGDLDDMMVRWTELVDDESGQPLDDRVGVDSLAIHGQVVVPGDLFEMPARSRVPDAKGHRDVPAGLVGQTWEFPPNRPQDRASVAPWRPSWGIPAWRMVGGRRVAMKLSPDDGDED